MLRLNIVPSNLEQIRKQKYLHIIKEITLFTKVLQKSRVKTYPQKVRAKLLETIRWIYGLIFHWCIWEEERLGASVQANTRELALCIPIGSVGNVHSLSL